MLGGPGAGKGTQAKKISARYDIPHISTGDIFRANIKNGTQLGIKAKSYMDKGLLVPDELVLEIIIDRLAEADCSKGYVLDGFPRTIPQAEALDAALNRHKESIDYAIEVDVPDAVIIKRMSGRRACPVCGASYHLITIPSKQEGICDKCSSELILRDDDKPETVQKRLEVYHAQTQPLLQYYKDKGVLRTVDGIKEPDEAFKDIEDILNKVSDMQVQ